MIKIDQFWSTSRSPLDPEVLNLSRQLAYSSDHQVVNFWAISWNPRYLKMSIDTKNKVPILSNYPSQSTHHPLTPSQANCRLKLDNSWSPTYQKAANFAKSDQNWQNWRFWSKLSILTNSPQTDQFIYWIIHGSSIH